MKNLLHSLLLASAGLFGAIPAQAAVTFSLDTAISQIQVGDYFDVDLVVHDLFAGNAIDELLAFGLNAISSDTGLLQLTGSTVNPLFSDDSVLLGLDAAGSAFPGIANDSSVAQAFSLATLHFQALAAGNVSLTIASDLADLNQGLIFWNQGQLAIGAVRSFDIAAVPLPSGVLLFVSGLAMSLGAVRKR
jgi:hypothetical protein